MALPKIDQPLFELTIPSTGKKVTFRPFVVKEEKLLLIAQSGGDTDMIRAIKQIIRNCVQEDINVDNLATFDLEYMFLKLRARSVNNIIKLSYRDNEDNELYDFEIDLDKIEIDMPGGVDPKIKINDTIGMTMKYPNAGIVDKIGDFENEVELLTLFITNCIDTIYDENDVYIASEYSSEELGEFIDSLDVTTFDKIREFFEKMPKLIHVINYKNKMGNDRTIELSSIKDFFM